MHWFWRALIALGVGFVAACVIQGRPPVGFLQRALADSLIIVVFTGIPILVVYAYLTRRYGPVAQLEAETRCRKCQYILRGITEPRCPECGERI